MDLSSVLPEGVPVWAAIAAAAGAYFAAALTAAFGIGGGLLLLAIMSAVFPPAAVVPVHGVAQLGSNTGRFILQFRHVVWPTVLWFAAGGVIGSLIGGRLALEMPVWALRAGVAAFIFYTVWGPTPKRFAPGPATFFTVGAVGSFLTMFFGATGPLAATMLSATRLERFAVTATHAACMVAQHGLKILVFGALGFAYADWAGLLAIIVAVGFLGTLTGTAFLRRMPEAVFRRGLRFLLTALAIYLAIAAGAELRRD